MAVTLEESAISEIKRVIVDNKLGAGTGLRLGIKGGGCAGFTYVFDFADKADEFDETFVSGEIPVFVDKKSFVISIIC